MAQHPNRVELAAVLRRATHPPLRDVRFYAIQAAVVLVAAAHLELDLHSTLEGSDFPVGIPVALLVLPVTYAALRYGLAGSAATGLWATLLWLPDLVLPHDQGHTGSDLINLALVGFVALVVGSRVEAERLAHDRAEQATTERMAVDARYRQLFEANRAPIVVLDDQRRIVDANPSARATFGKDLVAGAPLDALLSAGAPLTGQAVPVLRMADGREYRVRLAATAPEAGRPSLQAIFEDVTEEREESRRAARYASAIVQAEEDQRRRLARELHDEPLQLFLHLARGLESLAEAPGVPAGVRSRLHEASRHAGDAAGRLRSLARDLRPPALDQLGLTASISSLMASVEDEAHLATEVQVSGNKARLVPDVELAAFRIVEEAAHNTVRHACASRLLVSVHFGPAELVLTVADDGKGFLPAAFDEVANSGHLGLLGMDERARLLGGHLALRSAPGKGTVVEAVLPLTANPI